MRFNDLVLSISSEEIAFCLDEDGPLYILQESINYSIDDPIISDHIKHIISDTLLRMKSVSERVHEPLVSDDDIQSDFDSFFEISRKNRPSISESFSAAVCFALNKGRPIDAAVFLLLTRGIGVFDKVERLTRAMKKHGVEDKALFDSFPKRS